MGDYLTSVLVTVPSNAAISLAAAKDRLRIDGSADDVGVALLIAAATAHFDGAKGILGRALITQSWSDLWSGFPAGPRLALRLDPVQSISSVTYYDADNVQQTLAGADYTLHRDHAGAYLRLDPTAAWPSTRDRDDAVNITYVAGYGDDDTDVPAEIRLAGLDLVAHWDVNREAAVLGTISTVVPMGFELKVRRYIRAHF